MVNVHRLFHRSMRRLPNPEPTRPQSAAPASNPGQQTAPAPESRQQPQDAARGGK